MSGRVEGRVAFVTGAGSGIGRAVAIRLAEEGATVVVTSRTPAHLEETAALVEAATSRPPASIVLDQTDRAAIESALDEASSRFGLLDIVSNNAGVDDPAETPVSETPDEVWSETFSVNVDGVFRICRAAIPVLRDGGAIVNMGSVNSISPRSNAAAYCASKAALLQLTRSLALELAARQIRVNCVCPGSSTPRSPTSSSISPTIPRRCGSSTRGRTRSSGWPTRPRSRAASCSSPPTSPGSSPGRHSSSTVVLLRATERGTP